MHAVPAQAGEMLLWRGNLIHWPWVVACDAGEAVPRKSMASAFMPGVAKPSGSIARGRMEAGLSLELRLRIILKAMLMYEDWHPDFDGLAASLAYSRSRHDSRSIGAALAPGGAPRRFAPTGAMLTPPDFSCHEQ